MSAASCRRRVRSRRASRWSRARRRKCRSAATSSRGSSPGAEPVEDRQHVARRHHDDVGREIVDQMDLALGHAARDRDDGAAEPLGAVMRAEAAGEQAIAIGDMHHHAGPPAGRAKRPGDHVGPHVDVGPGVADDHRLAGRADEACRRMTWSRGTANRPKG